MMNNFGLDNGKNKQHADKQNQNPLLHVSYFICFGHVSPHGSKHEYRGREAAYEKYDKMIIKRPSVARIRIFKIIHLPLDKGNNKFRAISKGINPKPEKSNCKGTDKKDCQVFKRDDRF